MRTTKCSTLPCNKGTGCSETPAQSVRPRGSRRPTGILTLSLFTLLLAHLFLSPIGFGQTGTQDRSQDQDQDGWQFTVAPYLIFPWMDGKLAVRGREIDVDVSAGEIFDNLQFGAMGYLEAQKGKRGVAMSFIWPWGPPWRGFLPMLT